jgi:ABC-type bacteriocin/lantibiotic exporter with double-glycine peptidase domain
MYLAQRIDIPLMLGYYEHVINLPMNFFGTRKVGEIVSRFNHTIKIREAILGATLIIIIDTLMDIDGVFILFM